MDPDPQPPDRSLPEVLEALLSGLERLRKTVLRHGQAQELFQQRIDRKVDQLTGGESGEAARPRLAEAQLRALLELDKAVLAMAAVGEDVPRDPDSPASLREGLDLLHIRVRNLQRSFGLEPIPALGQPFDDRLHHAHSTCHRPDVPHGRIVEEVLPGYRLEGRVLRPARVVVNRLDEPFNPYSEEK
jgi:molecular chaperone GrpE